MNFPHNIISVPPSKEVDDSVFFWYYYLPKALGSFYELARLQTELFTQLMSLPINWSQTKVLEIGTGNGAILELMSRLRVGRYVGYEPSSILAKWAADRHSNNPAVEVRQALFPDEKAILNVDLVVTQWVTHEEPVAGWYNEVRKTMRTGAYLVELDYVPLSNHLAQRIQITERIIADHPHLTELGREWIAHLKGEPERGSSHIERLMSLHQAGISVDPGLCVVHGDYTILRGRCVGEYDPENFINLLGPCG